MATYLIANVAFTRPDKAQQYGIQVAATIQTHGGHYLVRGGRTEVVEGRWQPGYLSLVEFPALDDARRWYESAEYAAIKTVRHEYATSDIVFVDGLLGSDASRIVRVSDPSAVSPGRRTL